MNTGSEAGNLEAYEQWTKSRLMENDVLSEQRKLAEHFLKYYIKD